MDHYVRLSNRIRHGRKRLIVLAHPASYTISLLLQNFVGTQWEYEIGVPLYPLLERPKANFDRPVNAAGEIVVELRFDAQRSPIPYTNEF